MATTTSCIGLPGNRAEDAKPVQLGFWMDGKLLHRQWRWKQSRRGWSISVRTPKPRCACSSPKGEHVFRVGFIGDEFPQTLAEKDYYSDKKNKYPGTITFNGPFASNVEKASRKKICICDPKTGHACVEKIVANLAHHAYRRPVTKAEVDR